MDKPEAYPPQARWLSLRPFLKLISHYAISHRDFCKYCPKMTVCFNHRTYDDGTPHDFSKGRCENTLRRWLMGGNIRARQQQRDDHDAPKTSQPTFNPIKFKAIVSYIIGQCHTDPTFSMEKLHAMIYASEMRAYLQTGTGISNPTFIKREWGIECEQLQDTLHGLIQEGSIIFVPYRDYFSMA